MELLLLFRIATLVASALAALSTNSVRYNEVNAVASLWHVSSSVSSVR
jgi:hypothetical protein